MPLKFEDNPILDKSNYCSRYSYQAFLYGEALDIGGGTITKEEIDELADHPELTRISVAGLHQDTFEYFVTTYGDRFEGIYFFKNKMINDLSALGTLKNIKSIGYFLNQRATSLWDMSNNVSLEMLNIRSFSRLHNLNGFEKAPNLKYLDFGNGMWGNFHIDTVPDLTSSNIEEVCFNVSMSYESAYEFLKLKSLKNLSFSANLFKVDFLAWICSNYPHIEGFCLKPYHLHNENEGFICGKRKPYIDLTKEKDRIKLKKSIDAFDKMKEKYNGISFEDFMNMIDI